MIEIKKLVSTLEHTASEVERVAKIKNEPKYWIYHDLRAFIKILKDDIAKEEKDNVNN